MSYSTVAEQLHTKFLSGIYCNEILVLVPIREINYHCYFSNEMCPPLVPGNDITPSDIVQL
jgi:hypothetical protein